MKNIKYTHKNTKFIDPLKVMYENGETARLLMCN